MIIAIEPDAQNRTLRVEADGDNMFCSTEVQLAGDKEQRLHTVQFKNLAAGGYTLRAQVLSTSSVRSQATQEIMVTGDGQGTGKSQSQLPPGGQSLQSPQSVRPRRGVSRMASSPTVNSSSRGGAGRLGRGMH